MTRSDALLRLTSRLIARRDALRRSLAEEVSRLREPTEVLGYGDHVDAAVDSASDEICARLAEIESRQLAEIERTLRRIAEGSYGRCESCGGRIPAPRLNALPHTTRCIGCQRRDEGLSRSEVECPDTGRWSSVEEAPDRDGNGDPMHGYDQYSVRMECTV
jgi:DnaK suppressor protein